jgi:hypothetical protein
MLLTAEYAEGAEDDIKTSAISAASAVKSVFAD